MTRTLWGLLCAAAILAPVSSWGFEVRFVTPAGEPLTAIREGWTFSLVVVDHEKGRCGIDSFTADITILDLKTGAYIDLSGETFREETAGSGIYFWVDGGGWKRVIRLGYRGSYTDIAAMEHIPGDPLWQDGNWTYVDEDVEAAFGSSLTPAFMGDVSWIPSAKKAARFRYLRYDANLKASDEAEKTIRGRFENMDTLLAFVADNTDCRNIAGAQAKIVDTTSTVTVTPEHIVYGCGGAGCSPITVTIEDPDENLDPTEIDYVPFFVIVNPGGFLPDDGNVPGEDDPVVDLCSLLFYGGALGFYDDGTKQSRFGGAYTAGDPVRQRIRWYNIYDAPVWYRLKDSSGDTVLTPARYIDYPNAWLDPEVVAANGGVGLGRALFYAAETGPDTGVFTYSFGNAEELQRALGFGRFPAGTTIAFYYIDPNDFDDLSLARAEVGDRPHSETYVTDPQGNPVDLLRIGDGIYVRVLDADANINACCQDDVTVHLCDPHGEDDCEWWRLDEVANDAGIFVSQAAMPLLPVWDSVGGYQLVWDSDTFEAFNEDTILVRYTSVRIEEGK